MSYFYCFALLGFATLLSHSFLSNFFSRPCVTMERIFAAEARTGRDKQLYDENNVRQVKTTLLGPPVRSQAS